MKKIILAAAILSIAASTSAFAQSSDRYDSKRTENIINRMAETHGSYEEFLGKPSIEATFAMYLYSLEGMGERTWHDNWRLYSVTIEPSTSRGFVEMPHENIEGPTSGFNGKTMWKLPVEFDPGFQDPPIMLLYYHYSMVMLPFLAQGPESRFEYDEMKSLPGYGDHHVISVTFESNTITHTGEFKLWIDPETYIVRAYSANSMYPVLPGENFNEYDWRTQNTAMRLFESHSKVDGLLVPRSYVSLSAGLITGYNAGGYHLIPEFTIGDSIDRDKMEMPAGASVYLTTDGAPERN